MNGPADDECGDIRTQRHMRRRWGVVAEHGKGIDMAQARRWGLGWAVAAVAAALLLVGAGETARADVEVVEIPEGATTSVAGGPDELDLFGTFDQVSAGLAPPNALTLPIGWIPGAKEFGLDSGSIVIDTTKQQISIVATPRASSWPTGTEPAAGFLVIADWDETDPSDEFPQLTGAFRFDNVVLADLNESFNLGSNVPITLKRSWVVVGNELPRDLAVADLADQVKAFFGVGTKNAALTKDEPIALRPGANFVAEIDLTQTKPLRQSIALAGVDEIDLLLRGTLASDVSSLFGEADLAKLLELQLTASLSATGDNPPSWLEDRQLEMEFDFDDLGAPFIGIGDRVQTFVGDASNTFKRGVRFDPDFFDDLDTSVPLLLNFQLEGPLQVPFGIDVAGLLGVNPDSLSASFELGATLDLTQDNPVTSLDVGFNFDAGGTSIHMDIDTDPDGSVKAIFGVKNAGSVSQLVNRLASVFEVEAPNLAPIGNLSLQDATVTIKQKGKSSSVQLESTVGVYEQPFGISWLDLQTVTFDVTLSNQGTGKVIGETPSLLGSLTAQVDLAGKQWAVGIEIGGALKNDEVSLEGAITLSLGTGETLGIGEAVDLVGQQFPGESLAVPTELNGIALSNVELGLAAKVSGSSWQVAADAFAVATLPPLDDIAVYIRAGVAADEEGEVGFQFDVGVRPAEPIRLSRLIKIPGLSDKEGAADKSPELPAFAFVLTTQQVKTPAAQLTPAGFEFYKGMHGCAPETAQPAPGESLADKKPGDRSDPTAPSKCYFTLDLKPGANLIANLAAFPDEIDPLIKALWMDPDQGIQFIGRIPFPGSSSLDVDLQLRLPQIVPPAEIDFLTGGQLAIGVKAGTSGLETYLNGTLDTRWRRSDPNPVSCDSIGGDLLSGLDQVGDTMVENSYCYDRLRFEVESAIKLSTQGLTAKLSGAVISQNENFGWQEPFGVPNITIGKLALALEVGIKPGPPLQVSFNGGFAGDMILGDPEAGGKRFFGSAGAGFAIAPAPTPAGVTIVPSFIGVRGYVSSIGITDLAQLWQSLHPEAPPLAEVTNLPLAEIRNAEFMLAFADNDDLCLKTGVFLAGELYVIDELSEPGPVEVPPRDDDGCTPFGALVDPDTCLSDDAVTGRRDEGCFSTFFGQLALTGIIADGRVGALDLGPVQLDEAQMTLRLTPQQQALIVRGGATIIDSDVLRGELAVSLGLTTFDFYGKVTAFDAFLAEVDGAYALQLDDGFPPSLDNDLHVVLGADFDKVIVDPIVDDVRRVRNAVLLVEDTWTALTSSDYTALFDVPALEGTLGIELPQWLQDVIELAETAYGSGDTTGQQALDELFASSIRTDSICPLGQYLDNSGATGVCRWLLSVNASGDEPFCLVGTLSDDKKICTFSFQMVLDELSVLLRDGIAGLLPIEFDQLPSLSKFFTTIVDRLEQVQLFDVECAEFDYQTNSTGSMVDIRGKLTLLGTTYGIALGWDMKDDGFGVPKLLESIWTQLFGPPVVVQCSPAVVPAGVSPASFETVDVVLDSEVVDEGDTMSATVTFGSDPGADVTIDWGDGSGPVLMNGSGLTRTASHLYADDPRTPGDRYDVVVRVDGVPVGTAVATVRNVAPTVTATLDRATVLEDGTVKLTIDATDPGDPDPLRAVVTWGDGSSTVVLLPTGSVVLEHRYVDDPPTGVAGADLTVRVLVLDGDGGLGRAEAAIRIENDPPEITGLATAGSVTEGSPATFTITFDDAGLSDTHTVDVDWGDKTTSTVELPGGERTLQLTHNWVDDDPPGTPSDTYPVSVTVTDDDTGTSTRSFDVIVENVEPSALEFDVTESLDEYGTVTVSGGFYDPGLDDTHTVVVDWGNDALAPTTLDLDGERHFTATKRYGDNGVFTVTVTVTDDDTGAVELEKATEVRNVDPSVAISRLGSRLIGGISTFLLGSSEQLTLEGRAADRGSDDLHLTWVFDARNDDLVRETTSLVPGQEPNPDLQSSPSVRPRFGAAQARDTQRVVYGPSCLYRITLDAVDDDDGKGHDEVAAIMFDNRTVVRSPGYYHQQYFGRGGNLLSEEQRLCDVLIAEHISEVFGERILLSQTTAAATFSAAVDVLDAAGSDALDQFDRQLLATWLNVASGAIELDTLVDTDGDMVGDVALWDLLRQYEEASNETDPSSDGLTTMATMLDRINRGR